MAVKIVEALAKILEDININNIPVDEINNRLNSSKEFDKQTVGVAFSLIYDKLLVTRFFEDMNTRDSESFRILSDEEITLLGVENYNYLLHLTNIGLISSVEIDYLLNELLMYPIENITKDDINWLVFVVIVDFDSEIMPGSRILLYSSDTIN